MLAVVRIHDTVLIKTRFPPAAPPSEHLGQVSANSYFTFVMINKFNNLYS